MSPGSSSPSRESGDPQRAPTPAPIRALAEILENRDEGGGSRRLALRIPGWPGFAPGQFAMLSPGACAGAPRTDPLLPRPMAIYRATPDPDGASADGASGRVEVLYKVTGRGTALLADALPGQRVSWVGPLGHGFSRPAAGERALLVAGGTGIASVYELARALHGAGQPVAVLLGARAAGDLMGVDDFEALGVELRIATEDGSRGRHGLVTALLEEALAQGGPSRVYACGPTPMMQRCAELAAAGGAPCIASLENHMACGFGVCLGCAAPRKEGGYALVCRDGPMFDAASIEWERMP